MAGLTPAAHKPKHLDNTRIRKDVAAVTKILSTVECMINSFDARQDGLVCLSSGIVTKTEISKDLLGAQEKSETGLLDFLSKRLISATQDVFAPIKSQKLKTISDQVKPKAQSNTGKAVILHNNKNFLSKLSVLGQSRKFDLKQILCHSLGPGSYPLSSGDSLAKTNKSVWLI